MAILMTIVNLVLANLYTVLVSEWCYHEPSVGQHHEV